MKRVLAFFGAFNPPTLAHLDLARFAMEETGREGVVFVPSKSVYIRDDQGKDFAYGDAQRLSMLNAAAESRPWMEVTPWEIEAEKQPRTYVTLCHLKQEGYDPALLLGSDKLPELEHGWLYVKEIAREFGIVCMSRGGDDCRAMIDGDSFLSGLKESIRVVETPEAFRQVSSTAVRQRVRQLRALQAEISGMVAPEIIGYL